MPDGSQVLTATVDDHIESVTGLSRSLLADLGGALEEINEISRSTRIISMNARVEAARLGQAGAGFAVIAEEMTRLAHLVADVTKKLQSRTTDSGQTMNHTLRKLSSEVRETRLCELSLTNIDLIDRNLYERSCDVRWWATDAAVVTAVQSCADDDLAFASQRLGQILDSYTVYFDLVIATTDGTVVANGRPNRFRSTGQNVADQPWFRTAMATRDGSQFGFQSAHRSTLVGDQSALVYSCAIREGGQVNGRVLGVLGIVFNWAELAQTVIKRTPLSAAEWKRSRVCIVDTDATVLADTRDAGIGGQLDVSPFAELLRLPRAAAVVRINGEECCVAHALSPGFETYRTGWHSLIIQGLG